MQKIIEGIRRFQRDVFPGHRDHFESLAAGQRPEVILITCSDSRIDPALVTQTLPGELFLVRNPGNLVPCHDAGPSTEAAALEYAIEVVGVQHVVVCGHSHCGAMGAVLDPESARGLSCVSAALQAAGATRVEGANATLDDQVADNVRRQLDNLRTHPSVRAAEQRGDVALHGWIYDFPTGAVRILDPDAGEFVTLGDDATA